MSKYFCLLHMINVITAASVDNVKASSLTCFYEYRVLFPRLISSIDLSMWYIGTNSRSHPYLRRSAVTGQKMKLFLWLRLMKQSLGINSLKKWYIMVACFWSWSRTDNLQMQGMKVKELHGIKEVLWRTITLPWGLSELFLSKSWWLYL